jgi:hypothetical protein
MSVSEKKQTIQQRFDYILKDFESDTRPQEVWHTIDSSGKTFQEFQINFPPNQITSHPYIVFVVFVYLKQYRFFGKWEKVAWEIPIKFKGVPFILTHRKFGFKIISGLQNESIEVKGLEAISQIQKAIPFAEKLIEPVIKEKVNARELTLDNKYHIISRRYSFFRESAQKKFSYKPKRYPSRRKSNKSISAFIEAHNETMEELHTGNYFLSAMLDSYFCLLEHTLVLLFPFVDSKKLDGVEIESFISYKWKEKYKALFSVAKDKQALLMLERLDRIKEQLRNPLTHGYFLRDGHSIYVHMEQLGAIPMTLTKTNQQLKYSFGAIESLTFKEICKCFDDCDKFLYHNRQSKFGMQFIKSGASVAFDNTSSEMYKSAMITRKYFDEFVDYIINQQDNSANMDW